MKIFNHKTNLALSVCASLVLIYSCKLDLPTMADYDSYAYASLDEDGGTWKPILLSDPTDILLPIPEDVSSAEYQNELSEVKSLQEGLTDDQIESVMYWSNNSAIRWNEIALELIAKYNLIPGPNADGTYTLPTSDNIYGPPAFPFSHPPYGVRALAYLSVAQFDGLITAWHYKYEFMRSAPYVVSGEVNSMYADNGMPSYPSTGAVIAESSRRILTAMFPLEADYLQELADEHLESLKMAGVNVQSDIDAGKMIGKAVSDLALARANTDGMDKAQCSKEVSDSLAQAAFDRFGWQWENLEVPQRPVGLVPLYSEVKTWNLTSVLDVRPDVPPAIGSEAYNNDVKLLKDYADNLTFENRQLANFWEDGLGTYTPPGHWNQIAKNYMLEARMNPLRTVRTLAYLNMAMMDAGISCWDAKYYYFYPRPIQLIPDFKTIVGTPNFPSYTSGHSVFSAAASEILAYVFPEDQSQFRQWAEEAALSRVVGGIHWSFDATVGTTQGINVAQYSLDVARADGAD